MVLTEEDALGSSLLMFVHHHGMCPAPGTLDFSSNRAIFLDFCILLFYFSSLIFLEGEGDSGCSLWETACKPLAVLKLAL